MGYKEIVSDALSIVDVLQSPELREKFIKMREYTLELREKYSDLNEQFINQKEKITDLESRLKDKDEMVFEKNHYVNKNDSGIVTTRICSKCYDDKNGKKIRLHEASNDAYYRCPVCSTVVKR